jgi:hypothetical protein
LPRGPVKLNNNLKKLLLINSIKSGCYMGDKKPRASYSRLKNATSYDLEELIRQTAVSTNIKVRDD